MKDYYNILEIDRSASAEDIKRAYRRMAARNHPDKGGDTEKFQEVQEAYATLSDPNSKARYDQPQQPHIHVDFGGHGFSFDSMFEAVRQAHTQFHGRHTARQQMRLTLWLTIMDVFLGGKRPVSIGTTHGNIIAEIEIPPGVGDSETLHYGGIGPSGQDIYVTFRHHASPQWKIDGANVITEKDVSVWDCIVGARVIIKGIQGDELSIVVPSRTQPGTVFRLKEQGLPIRHGIGTRGDLLIKIRTVLPAEISDELMDKIKNETNT